MLRRSLLLVPLFSVALVACPESEKKSETDASSAASNGTATTASTVPPPIASTNRKAPCTDDSQCIGGACEYLLGCKPLVGFCGPIAHSCLVSRPYCGCDGVTFNSCPPPHHSYAHEGPCEPPRDK